jgi:dipeptide transport system substrate-binding protein
MKKGLAKLTLALMAAGAIGTSAHAASTLVYCSEGSPEGFNPAFYTSGTTFDATSKKQQAMTSLATVLNTLSIYVKA